MTDRFDRRRALQMFGVTSLSALLVACSGDDDSDSGAANDTPDATDAPSAATDAPAGGNTTATPDPFDDAGSCTLAPELTEGPFYVNVDQIRGDLREGRDGVPLRLALRVRDAAACAPIADALVDVWHCDASGEYSAGGETYLRGAQVTNTDGVAEFTTIYPGWYQGRTIHIHVKVHLDNTTVLTTQLFFDDAVSASVLTNDPYGGEAPDQNGDDSIFDEQLVLTLAQDGDGYVGRLNLDVA